MSYVFQKQLSSRVDSVIWAYKKATTGDPCFIDAWERLARLLLRRTGDTLGAIEACWRMTQSNVDPGNGSLRAQVVRMWRIKRTTTEALLDRRWAWLRRRTWICIRLRATTDVSRLRGLAVRRRGLSELIYEREPRPGRRFDFLVQVVGAAELAADTARPRMQVDR